MQLLSLALLIALPLNSVLIATSAVESCPKPIGVQTTQKKQKFAPEEGLIHVSSEAELQDAIAENKAQHYILDFSTSWCSWCKKIAGPYKALAQDPENANIFFIKVDATGEAGSKLANKHNIKGYPTFEFYQNGSLVSSFPGGNEDLLRNEVEKLRSSVKTGRIMPGVRTVSSQQAGKPNLAQVIKEEAQIEEEEATLAEDVKALTKKSNGKRKAAATEEEPVRKKQRTVAVAAGEVKHLTSTNEHEQLINAAQKPVIVKVYSQTCQHCKKAAGPFREHAAQAGDTAVFAEIEVGAIDDAFRRDYKITAFPTFLAFRNGNLVAKQIGADLDDLGAFIRKNIR